MNEVWHAIGVLKPSACRFAEGSQRDGMIGMTLGFHFNSGISR